MEEDQNVLHTKELNWYEEDENRLDYDVAFKERRYKKPAVETEEKVTPKEPQVDVKRLIKNRDSKWEQRLEKARKEAFAKGREQGYEEGFEKAQQKIVDKVDGLEHWAKKAHQDWERHHQLLNTGLLDLAFDMIEEILGLPIKDPEMREQIEEKLSRLMAEADEKVAPQLWVSEHDYAFVETLVYDYAPKLPVAIRVSGDYNPGEFELETQDETVIHWLRKKLAPVVEEIEEEIKEQMGDMYFVDAGTKSSEPDAVERTPDEPEVTVEPEPSDEVENDSLDKVEADTSDNVEPDVPDKTEEPKAQVEEDEIEQDVNAGEEDSKSEEPVPQVEQAEDDPKKDTTQKEFVFEDIVSCSDSDIQTIIEKVEETDLAMGLKGADWHIKQKFLDNMSDEAGAMLQEEMDGLGPAVPLNDVKEAQSRTIQKIKQLDDEGQITIH